MRHRIFILSLIAFLRLPAQQPAQYEFQHLDQSDGLLHNNVMGMRQDTRGFIWVRTPNGLQRYDGNRFVTYRSILDNPVTGPVESGEIYFDSGQNAIWLMGNGLTQKLSLTDNVSATYNWQQLQNSPDTRNESFLSGDSSSWVLNEKVLFESAKSTTSYMQVLHSSFCKPGESGQSIYDSTHQIIWLSGAEGLVMVDKKAHRIYDARSNPLHHPLLDQSGAFKPGPRVMMMDRKGNIWISTWSEKFFRYDPATKKLNVYSLAAIKSRQSKTDKLTETLLVNAMFEDRSGVIWIATENAGLLKYIPEKNNFESIEVEAKNRNALQYNYKIFCILQDKEENLWLGTDQGISIFNPSRQFFRSIRHRINQPSLPKAEITRVHQCNNGDILVGTWGSGFSVYDGLWNFRRK